MNIVIIAEKSHYRDWKGKTYYDILLHYKEFSINNITLIFSDEYMNYSVDTIKILNPSLICFFETDVLNIANYFSYVFEIGIPVYYCGLDLFYFNNCIQCPNIKLCNGIIHFSKAENIENSYRLEFPKKIITHFNARFINSYRFKNYNMEKKYDILIYGSRGGKTSNGNKIQNHISDQKYIQKYNEIYDTCLTHHYFYPLRVKIEELLLNNSDKYRLKILDNACIFNAAIANDELSQLINESYMTLSCCTRADIAMAKYFEIPASYSAILGDIPSDYEDLFKGNIVEVNEWMSDDEILQIIDKALEDKDKLWEMTKRLGDRVHQEYNLEAGTRNMDEVFENMFNFYN